MPNPTDNPLVKTSDVSPSGQDFDGDEQNRWSKAMLIRWFRILMMISVVLAIAYTAITSFQQLREEGVDFSAVNYGWWIAAVGVYIGTMFLSCCFWFRVLMALGQKPKFGAALLAFFASQLGKYVPGKAMVVVIRTDMIRGDEVGTAPAAASVFVETLTWIFVGSVIGSLLLVLQFEGQTLLKTIGVLLAVVAGVLTWPPVFRWIALKLGVVKGRKAKKLLNGLNFQTMSFGWLLMSMGWCLNGLSLWMVLKGLPETAVSISDFSLAMVCVSLATVAGFVSLLPGGLGVRELVMIPLLGSQFGAVTAIVAAIVIRVIWLTAELATSGIIYAYRQAVVKVP
ncbi:MAG: lysylphosphatidylglycerol synthase transmembrane domain-containing protein [Mariniblastus sp.]